METTVSGGPRANVFRVQGPDAGGVGVDAMETDRFAVSGKVWQAPEQGMLALQDTSGTIDAAAAGPEAVGACAPSR